MRRRPLAWRGRSVTDESAERQQASVPPPRLRWASRRWSRWVRSAGSRRFRGRLQESASVCAEYGIRGWVRGRWSAGRTAVWPLPVRECTTLRLRNQRVAGSTSMSTAVKYVARHNVWHGSRPRRPVRFGGAPQRGHARCRDRRADNARRHRSDADISAAPEGFSCSYTKIRPHPLPAHRPDRRGARPRTRAERHARGSSRSTWSCSMRAAARPLPSATSSATSSSTTNIAKEATAQHI
ncbi:hypothetical protein APR08_005605 [Nocardia amikacinitolerans]|nr:hypothetical protein [Nocardia amikacinitolerans]